MIVYMDLENLLKEKNVSQNKLCESCNLQRTQLNNYCSYHKICRISNRICQENGLATSMPTEDED